MLLWLALAALVAIGCVSAADAQTYNPSQNFTGLQPPNGDGKNIWSDCTTMWVLDDNDDRVYAYDMLTKSSDMSKQLNNTLMTNAGNNDPRGIWSDGTTMWVADTIDFKVYAYNLAARTIDITKNFTINVGSPLNPDSLWSDGTTMWIGDSVAGVFHAYRLSDGSYDMSKNFNVTDFNPDNNRPIGIWSDGTTLWVLDNSDDKIYAYNWATKARDMSKDFDTLKTAGDMMGNTLGTDIWSDHTHMWVVDWWDDQIYAYDMPPGTAPARSGPCAPPAAPATSSPRTFVYIPPPDTTPPTVKSVERTGNATTADHTLTWDVRFSESVRVGLKEIHTNYTSVANATIPDLGMVHDTLLAGAPGMATGGSISVDLQHPITSGLLIELVAPDCTKFTIHNQTTTFPYKLRQPHDLGDLSGVGAAGQWTLYVHDLAKYWNGTLNGWTLYLESRGVVEGGGRTYTITQYVASPGEYTLSLDGFDIRDRAGNRLADTDPAVNEPYRVVGAARACHTE